MAEVTVHVNGRGYPIACEDGQEAHLERLAAYIDQRVGDLIKDVGQVGDARLLVMASLLIADELADAYDELQALRSAAVDSPTGDATNARSAATGAEERAAAAERAAQIAQRRVASLEAELAKATGSEGVEEKFAAGLETLASRVAALAARIEGGRA